MSKDQMSWEQLLSSEPASEQANESKQELEASSTPEAETARTPAAIRNTETSELPKTSETLVIKKSRKKPSESQVSYSKKDWGRLDIPSTTPSTTSATTLATTSTTTLETTQPAEVSKETAPAPSNEPVVMTVSQLNKHIRELLEGEFRTLWLKGEISNFKAHTSGHFYFSLKDSKAQISAVMFRGYNGQLRFRPEDGMEVLVRGKITVYEPRGNYQIFCEAMEPVGAGALQKAFEQLKAKLQKEGLFDQGRKRPLPALPKHIAIITSPTGAAIRDMLNVLGRRFKGAIITVIPCKVQGDQAPREIIEAIRLASRLPDIDVMIVGRGGGSIEDLWAFNDEGVARAIAAAHVPIISAVGHEVDFTIADFVADLRAPTPSAAAELVVKSAADLMLRVAAQSRALTRATLQQLQQAKLAVGQYGRRLVDPQRRIQDASMRCDELLQRLQQAAVRNLKNRHIRVELYRERLGTPLARINHDLDLVKGLGARMRAGIRNLLRRKSDHVKAQMAVLDSLSPLKVLDRGYSMVVSNNEIVTKAQSLAVGQVVTVRMGTGKIEAEVRKIENER